MFASIKNYCDQLVRCFNEIPPERKQLLEGLSVYLKAKKVNDQPIRLIYICTHNSRRSHFGQIWAHVAADYYKISDVTTYSGGTEATSFNENARAALQRIGFIVVGAEGTINPVFELSYSDAVAPIRCFSKTYDHPTNPTTDFAAIMTCSDAEQNCPFIPGVELRIGTTYSDPKAYDTTPECNQQYDLRCRQIALETFYVFSNL